MLGILCLRQTGSDQPRGESVSGVPFVLRSLFNFRPLPRRFRSIPDKASLCSKHTKGFPSPIRFSVPAILEAELSIVKSFAARTVANRIVAEGMPGSRTRTGRRVRGDRGEVTMQGNMLLSR